MCFIACATASDTESEERGLSQWRFFKTILTLGLVSVVLFLANIQPVIGQPQTLTSRSSQLSTFTDAFHGFEMKHPNEWQPGDYSITDGEYALVTRFDQGIPPEPFLNIAFTDLSNRENVTLDEFTAGAIARIEEPLIVGDEVLSESVILESEPSILANRTAHKVVWEEQPAQSGGVDSSADRKMSIWTMVGERAWELTYVAPGVESYSEHLATVEEMINSFKILPQADKTGYVEYADTLRDFNIDMPSTWKSEEEGETVFLRSPITAAGVEAMVTVKTDDYGITIDIEEYADLNLANLNELESFNLLTQGYTTLSGRPAWYLIHEDTTSGLIFMQVTAMEGSTTHMISYGATPDAFGNYLPTVRTMLESFEVTSEDTGDFSMNEFEDRLDEILGLDSDDDDTSSDTNGNGDSSSSSSGSSRCPDGYHRSPSGDCERVTDTRGLPRCPDGYHRSPDGDCERVS